MAERKIQIRTRQEDRQIEVIARIEHPMETGLRTDPETKQKVPPHFIQQVKLEHNGKVVAVLDCGPAVSKNPLLAFGLKDAKAGDKIRLIWSDNKGESGSHDTTVKL